MPPPAAPATNQVFLSYSRNDREAAVALRSALEQAGLSVFKDDDSIRVGDRWVERLQDALEGCSAFVLLVGRDGVQRWVGAEAQVALARHLSPHDEAQRLPIFPILLGEARPEGLPPFLALFQAIRWAPAEAVPGALIEAIRARAIRLDYPQAFEGCPFLGLNAFGRADARLFFGRRKETLEALACLGDQQQTNPEQMHVAAGGTNYCRWLQIEGNSGAGKSSLVNAGMLPMIEQGALWARTGFERWVVLGPMMPGMDPLTKLVEVLEALIADPARRDSLARRQRFEQDERAFALALRDFRQEHTAFLLVVDQFEELFTFADDASRRRFDAVLTNALQDPECPLFLVSTVRADFLDRFEQLPRLQAIYNSHCKRYFLPTISEHGLREVIEQPARLAGLDVSEITTAILDDARDEIGALPLVENALFMLWQQREGNRLSGDRYRRESGIAGMLRTQADALLDRIDGAVPKGKQAALELLLRLTRINDEGRHTRQRITREEAVMIAGAGRDAVGERVVQMLSGERAPEVPVPGHSGALRLITTSTERKDGAEVWYVDLIHETLIRARGKDPTGKLVGYWPTLYEYIEENRDRDIQRQQLKFRTERWLRSRGPGRLWNLAYIGVGDYRALRLPPRSDEARFLSWSRRARRVVVSLLAVVAAYFGESYYWTKKNELPFEAIATLQRFRLGYAPVPEFAPDIPPGSFEMGEQDAEFVESYGQEDHRFFGVPGRPVEIDKGFRLTRHEITYDQFDYYVWKQQDAGHDGVKFPTTAKGGRGNLPVVNGTWHEANSYAQWLGRRTKQDCRLPTEAEWEYAARAKTSTAYPWGDELGKNRANCKGCGSPWDNEQSAPVGSFAPNGFGLYDVSGNVWEWTCSLWRDRFDGGEQRCAEADDTRARAVRGGSWGYNAGLARSAARRDGTPGDRFGNLGFRVFCSPPIE
jgi:formylglycine-generating enzyme required for sulfatase activity